MIRKQATWLLALLAACALQARAEDAAADATAQAVVNPKVVEKLTQMGNYLRSLSRFEVKAAITHDTVLETGQKLQIQGTSTLQVVGRDRFHAVAETDTLSREFFYNGTVFTQYSPDLHYYTTVNAPPKLTDMLHEIEDHYGIQVPMEDLFLFGTDQSQAKALTSAMYIGPSHINGKLCDHLAFRQEGIDWQLWITRSDKPLPCKLVITTTDDTSFPEYSALYTWNLKPGVKATRSPSSRARKMCSFL